MRGVIAWLLGHGLPPKRATPIHGVPVPFFVTATEGSRSGVWMVNASDVDSCCTADSVVPSSDVTSNIPIMESFGVSYSAT